MKKKIILPLLFGLLLIIASACGKTESDKSESTNKDGEKPKETITLKFAAYQPAAHSAVAETFIPFMERVTEETDGQVKFDFYPGEQLGKAADMLDLTGDGVTDIAYYVAAYHPSQMPIMNPLMGLPGIYSTAYEGTMAYHELSKSSPVLESDFLSNGVRPILGYATSASEIFTSGQEIKTPADLKDLKVRISGEIANKAVSALGASPINLTTPELYEGFERNVFGAIIMNTASMKDYGLNELAKYGTMGVSFGGVGTGLIINEKTFQGLPENVQEAIVRIGDEFTVSNAKFYDEQTTSIVQKFKEEGINIHEPSADEKAQWQEFYNDIEADWLKEKSKPELEEAIKAFREGVKKYK